jgi:small subunit ribosomal protein S15
MARVHTRGKGKSSSRRPLSKQNPAWVTLSGKEVEELAVKYKREGATGAQVGLRLRDLHAIPSIKLSTGKSLDQILKDNKVTSEIPDDMMSLMRKAVNLDRHIQKNIKDHHNKHALQNVEAKIRRLVNYYQKTGRIPAAWRYSLSSAKLLVE